MRAIILSSPRVNAGKIGFDFIYEYCMIRAILAKVTSKLWSPHNGINSTQTSTKCEHNCNLCLYQNSCTCNSDSSEKEKCGMKFSTQVTLNNCFVCANPYSDEMDTQSNVYSMQWVVKPLLLTGILRQIFTQCRLWLVLM